MFQQNKLNFIIFISFLLWFNCTQGEPKILKNFKLALKDSLQDETISLDGDGNIIREGKIVQKFSIANDPEHVQKVITVFVADKNGFKTKYTLIKQEFTGAPRLSVSTLKAAAG